MHERGAEPDSADAWRVLVSDACQFRTARSHLRRQLSRIWLFTLAVAAYLERPLQFALGADRVQVPVPKQATARSQSSRRSHPWMCTSQQSMERAVDGWCLTCRCSPRRWCRPSPRWRSRPCHSPAPSTTSRKTANSYYVYPVPRLLFMRMNMLLAACSKPGDRVIRLPRVHATAIYRLHLTDLKRPLLLSRLGVHRVQLTAVVQAGDEGGEDVNAVLRLKTRKP